MNAIETSVVYPRIDLIFLSNISTVKLMGIGSLCGAMLKCCLNAARCAVFLMPSLSPPPLL